MWIFYTERHLAKVPFESQCSADIQLLHEGAVGSGSPFPHPDGSHAQAAGIPGLQSVCSPHPTGRHPLEKRE